MSITASDIQNEGFSHSRRGYDVEQVDVFLERVAQEVDAMNNTIADLSSQLDDAREELEGYSQAPEASGEEVAELTDKLEKAEGKAKEAYRRMTDAVTRAKDAESKLEEAQRKTREAEAKLEPLQAKLEEKNKLDSAISEAFISAQVSADALKEEARAEGERIYRESEAKAREFIREALEKKASIYSEIDALKQSSDDFRQQYVKMVESFAEQAKEKFFDMEPPQIPDGIINEMLPDIESMPGLEAQQAADAGDAVDAPADATGEVPKLSGSSIPEVTLPGADLA